MEERLRFVLSSVNEWLKFAEAKNGALLAVDIAILFGLFQLISDVDSYYWIYFAAGFVALSAVVVLISFVPQLKVPRKWFVKHKNLSKEISLIFYAQIANLTPENYVKALYTQSGRETSTISPLELDYAQQIIANSRIAVRKGTLFNIGLLMTVLSLLLILIPGLLSLK